MKLGMQVVSSPGLLFVLLTLSNLFVFRSGHHGHKSSMEDELAALRAEHAAMSDKHSISSTEVSFISEAYVAVTLSMTYTPLLLHHFMYEG